MLKVNYELIEYGWAQCIIVHNEKKIVVLTSMPEEALSELLEATHRILEKNWQAASKFQVEWDILNAFFKEILVT